MFLRKPHQTRRCGAAAVETAVVMIPFITFLFGIFEYGLLLMDWNLLNNSAREGARFALANNTDPTITSDVQSIVTTHMAGRDAASFTGFTTTVTGTHQGVATPVNNLVPGDLVTVTVSGSYNPLNLLPLIPMHSFTLSSSVTMVCEGGT